EGIVKGKAGAVVYAQRVDYPRASDVFSIYNLTDRPLAYGMYLPYQERVWLLHDSLCQPPDQRGASEDNRRLGIRYLYVFTGTQVKTIDVNATLDPGVGNATIKADECSKCIDTPGGGRPARCAACWLEAPRGAMFMAVWVESSGQKQARLVVIPLVSWLYGERGVVVETWRRWGLTREPVVQTAVATRVVDSQSVTYLVEVAVYRWP
ncbi:MAG: hypothetical protein ACK4SY_10740, partial [Pyrobaculum sp.]